MALLTVTFAAALCFPASALAENLYIAPNEMGGNDCLSPADACTLPEALTDAAPHDVLILAGNEGTYGTPGLPLSGLNLNPTAFLANIEGAPGEPRPVIYTHGGLTNYCGGDCGTISDLEIHATDAISGGLEAYGDVDHVLVETTDTSTACQIAIGYGPGALTVTDSMCLAEGEGDALVFSQEVGGGGQDVGPDLRNDTLYAAEGGKGAAFDWTNGGSGEAELSVSATNTIFHGDADIFTEAGANASIDFATDHSDFQSTNAYPGTSITSGAGDQTKPPTYVDAATGNLHEALGSVTIDHGINSSLNGTTDLDGNPRTIGASTDIGAYESAEAPTVTGAIVSDLSTSGAKLSAAANPNHSATTVTLYAGTTTADERPVSSQSIGSGVAAVPLSFSLTGLTPDTLYHFHLVGSNAIGSAPTADQAFTTTALPGTIKFDSTKPKVKGRKAAIRLTCSKGSTGCHGTLTLTGKVKVGRHTVTRKLGHVMFALNAGQTKTFKVKLSSAAVKKLKATANHHFKVTGKISRSDAGKAQSKRLTLVRVGGTA